METFKNAGKPHPVITQTTNNTTLWIGHLQSETTDHLGGQTFNCPVEGELDNIQIFSAVVHYPGEMILTFHSFDEKTKSWGAALATSTISIQKTDEKKWIRFSLPSVSLHKNNSYGFQLHAKNALVGIGEAATGNHQPFTNGLEWHGNSVNSRGEFFSFFNLAYKIEMCA